MVSVAGERLSGSTRRVASVAALLLLGAAWTVQRRIAAGAGSFPLLVGLCGVAALLLRVGAAAPGRSRASAGAWRVGEWPVVLLLLAWGAAWRLLRFGSFPDGMNHDAAWNGMYAIHILQGAQYTPYVSAAWGRETLFMYVAAPFVHWLGNTPEAVQAAATLCGIAALLPAYWLARELFGKAAALCALALLAVSGWHLVFSRVGWRCILLPPFAALAFAALWRGAARGRLWAWALAGGASAAALYTYNAGRVVPVAAAALGLAVAAGRRCAWRRNLAGAVLAAVVFGVVAAPMLRYAAANWQKFSGRAEHLMVEREQRGGWRASLAATPRLFNVSGNGNDFFVREPLLEPVAGVAFLCGLFLLLLPPWRMSGWFALGALIAGLLPGVVTIPNGNRCVAALPLVYAIAGVGMVAAARAVRSLGGRGLAVLAVAVVAGTAASESWRDYLDGTPRPMIGIDPQATGAGEYLRRHVGRAHVYVIAEGWPDYTLIYLGHPGAGSPFEPQFVRGHDFAEVEARIPRYGRRDLVFVLDDRPAGRDALWRLRRMFPAARVEAVRARRAAGAVVGRAVVVHRDGGAVPAARTNPTRVLELRGGTTAARCFSPVPAHRAWTGSLRLAFSGETAGGGASVQWVRGCGTSEAEVVLELQLGPGAMEWRAGGEGVPVPAAAVKPGVWSEVHLAVAESGRVDAWFDRTAVLREARLPATSAAPVDGVRLAVGPGTTLFADDLVVVGRRVVPEGRGWPQVDPRAPEVRLFENFERRPFGALGKPWRVEGALAIVREGPGSVAAPARRGANAFDGVAGEGPGEMREPMGVAVAPDGSIFVTDRRRHLVQKFAPDGTFLLAFGGPGDSPGRLREPHDVAADDVFVYVADTWHHLVQVFDHQGRFAFAIGQDPPLASPRGVGVGNGRICVVDSGHGQVRVYERGGSLLWRAGEKGRGGAGFLHDPIDCAFDARGRILVVNPGNDRIEVFGPDGSPLAPIPVPGWTGGVLRESYLAVGEEGVLYLTDWDARRVRRLLPTGEELPALGPPGDQPTGIAVCPGRVLYAARAEHVLLVAELAAGEEG